jgi:hypothetical protein
MTLRPNDTQPGRAVTMSQPKPPVRPATGPDSSFAKPGVAASHPATNAATPRSPLPAQPTGNVVHDARGNAVWDWLKETSRIAIESTTRLLRKLEAPELKMEDTRDEELRIMPDDGKRAGGGYDPYNQANKARKPGK